MIKMRAWNGTSMEYGGFCVHATGKVINDAPGLSRVKEDSPVMLATGLVDMTGGDIFDGDILTSSRYPFENEGLKNYVGVVVYEHGCFYLDMYAISDRVAGRAAGGVLEEYASACVVIGNIYEEKWRHLL